MTCFIHHIPGRLRIKIPSLQQQPGQAQKIRSSLSGMYGIDNVSVNTLTGSIVIYYDPAVFSVDQLINILQYDELIDSNQPVVFKKPIGKRSTQMGIALGKAAFSWVVGRVLERSGLGFLAVLI